MDWIINNKEWLFSGIGVALLTFLTSLFIRSKKETNNELMTGISNNSTNNNTNTNTNSNIVNVNIDNSEKKEIIQKAIKNKEDLQLLFIDDEKFEIVSILKGAGWINTKTIKDVKNLDCLDVKNSDVIFVDINGVGCSLFPKDQGLGLAEAIKSRNPEKFVIIYSAQEQRLHKAFSIVDAVLPKNAEPYEFMNILDNYLRKKR